MLFRLISRFILRADSQNTKNRYYAATSSAHLIGKLSKQCAAGIICSSQ